MKRTYIILLSLTLLATPVFAQKKKAQRKAAPATQETTITTPKVKNVIFIVGDGMGTAQVYSSIVTHGQESQFLRFPFSGFSRTYSLNKYTTDSGAGGSALMTGNKVNNYHIAMSPEGVSYPSFLKVAHDEYSKKTGIVVTCSPLDATPASTYGHVDDRKKWDELSMQMARCDHDVIIGADLNSFLPENRKDGMAPLDTLISRGYNLILEQDKLYATSFTKFVALLDKDKYPGDAEKRNNWLAPSADKAIKALKDSDRGFVMMIEGSQIDWACHNNDFAYLQKEMDEFEMMLKIVLDFAENDGETLVIVTADHETGGLTLNDGSIDDNMTTETKFTTGSHTGVMVPVFAFGPGAENFSGIQQNTDFYKKILELLK